MNSKMQTFERKKSPTDGPSAAPHPSGRQRRPILLINLKRDTERLAFMKRQLDGMNLEFETVEAVDGRTISEEEKARILAPEMTAYIHATEMGCYLSHQKAHQIMAERNIPEALILEDDVLLNEEFAEVFNGCELPEECQILQLVGKGRNELRDLHKNCSSLSLPLPGGYWMSPRIGVLHGVHAYIIRLRYARRLAQDMLPMIMRTDNLMFSWQHCLYLPWIVYKRAADSRRKYSLIGKETSVVNKRADNRDEREAAVRSRLLRNIRKKGKKLPPRKKGRPPPVFVINLKRDALRLAAMKQRLDADNIPFETIAAVDGKPGPATNPNDAEAEKSGTEAPTRAVSPVETGRFLSHLKAYQAALKTGAPQAVILEDNASLGEDFPAWFHGGAEGCRISNMKIVQNALPMHRRYFSPYRALPLPNEIETARPEDLMSGPFDKTILRQYARAYIIRRSQMQRLLKRRKIVDAPIDALLFHHKRMKPRNWLLKSVFALWMQCSLLRWPWLLNHGEKVQLYRLEDRSRALRHLKTVLSLYALPKPFGVKRPRVPSGAGNASP